MLTLTRLIAHQITKEQHQNTATLKIRDVVLPIASKMSKSLLEQLSDSFIKRSPISGRFKAEKTEEEQQRDSFRQLLTVYQVNPSDAAFVKFTQEAAEALRGEMAKQRLATGGYVIFAEYKDKAAFLLTALLSTTAQPSFDEKLNLIESVSLDLAHLRHGSRTRLAAIKKNAEGVVEFISERGTGVSEYFIEFIGCEEVARPDQQGRVLHEAIRDWSKNQNLDDQAASALLGGAYAYWRDSRSAGRPLKLTEIARVLQPADPDSLLAHLAGGEYDLAGQFSAPQPETMKRFVRFAFSGQGLKLEFDRNTWMNRIEVNKQKRTLTIREVPEELIAALSEGVV